MSTTSAAPSLYDLLDVAPDAPAGEIRAAWRSAIDGLEPGDRRFRAYNAAAETLLDHDRRAAYDAERRFRDGPGGPPQPAEAASAPLDHDRRAAYDAERRFRDGPGGPPQPAEAASAPLDHDGRAAYDAERRFRDGPGGPPQPAEAASAPLDHDGRAAYDAERRFRDGPGGAPQPAEAASARAAETLLDHDGRAAYDSERRFRDGPGGPPQPAEAASARAAETLLDHDGRAAYDAERRFRDGPGGPPQPAEAASARAAETLLDHDGRAAYDAERRFRDGPGGPPQPPEAASPLVEEGRSPVSKPAQPTDRRPVPGWLLVGLALLTAGAVASAAWLWSQPSDAAVAASTREAQAAAERAIVPVLSYDARTLDEDQAAGAAYLTADYRKDFDQLYEVIRQNAPRVGTAVSAEVVASGIVRSGPADPDRVEVLVFVNRPTSNKRTDEPVVYRDQVTVTMQNVDGSWLVDGLRTSPAGK